MRSVEDIEWARWYHGRSTLQRFLSYVRHEKDGCWIWTGYTHPRNGYGLFRALGPKQQTHRVMFELYYGRIPDGLNLDHLCRVRACVNPEHLEPVTQKENMARAVYSTGRRGPYAAASTRCRYGHVIEPDSRYRTPNGLALCATCVKRTKRESYYKAKERKQLAAAPVVGDQVV